ncbi:MAG TPA: DNA ligase D [Terriglobia bacterium]|nr:DNA ligase D [Terriglobia bacterium]
MSSLKEYHRKRQFEATPEPRGSIPSEGGARARFVVQKHDATRLHYDFRLEIDGVLKSWAVPKGPSLNPADKRLAMETEDHPLDYASFEGVIPKGNYGAGPVMVWDAGFFEPTGDVHAMLQKGDLKFTLHGEKLKGEFALVRIKSPQDPKGKPWLLLKHRDEAADPHWRIDQHDGSVATGRTLQEIETGIVASGGRDPLDPATLDGARRGELPAEVRPMLATLVDKPFSDPDWLFEVKWDGVRALAWIRDGKLELRSRTSRPVTSVYPELQRLPEHLTAHTLLLDGEIVALDSSGRSDFGRLQNRMNVARPSPELVRGTPVIFYLFDILYCDGYDLRQVPLIDRKEFLRALLGENGTSFRYSDHFLEQGKELFEAARAQHLEGILAKYTRSFYSETRSTNWLKIKILQDVYAVVGGYTEPRRSREFFGALLLGLYRGESLEFIGGVGTGFDQDRLKAIYDRIKPLGTKDSPFSVTPKTSEPSHWLKPSLVAKVKFSNWTHDGHLRAPVFLGLEDRPPEDCRFEDERAASSAGVRAEVRETPAPSPGKAASARQVPGVSGGSDVEHELLENKAESLSLDFGGKRVKLTHLNKVYFPESGYTKRLLLAYYARVAPFMLPFLQDRPLVLRRYPDGIQGEAFFQKEVGRGVPEWIDTATVYSEERGAEMQYFVANDLAALLYLTNLGCIDHNPWSSRRGDLDHPDYVFFDLDPSDGTDFSAVVEVGKAVLDVLKHTSLKVYLKTSGATGLHIYIPLQRGYTYEQVRTFGAIVGRLAAAKVPDLVTHERIVAKRKAGTVLIDAEQNAYGRPLATVYSARAFPQAPVSAPISPRELQPSLKPADLNIKTLPAQLKKRQALWADFWESPQDLAPALERLSQKTSRPRRSS